MTKIKTELVDVNIKEVKTVKSKRGNDYLVLNSEYNGQEINFYYPDFVKEQNFIGVHNLSVEIKIAPRFSSLTVLEVK